MSAQHGTTNGTTAQVVYDFIMSSLWSAYLPPAAAAPLAFLDSPRGRCLRLRGSTPSEAAAHAVLRSGLIGGSKLAAATLGWVSDPRTDAVPVLCCRGVRKTYGSGRATRVVLDGVDLQVDAGELVAVVGRSGSGKSTLLQIAGGLDRADGGSVEVAGRPVTGASERELSVLRREAIGFIFQFFHLLPELDGEANVMLPARLPGARQEMLARGQTLIDGLGLRDVAGLAPHQLSGGEQQRFAMARALVGDPLLVLADEPIGNLDADSGAVVLDLLRAVADDGRGVLMVTHQAEATARADRVLRLDEGVLHDAAGGPRLLDHADAGP